MAQVVLYKTRLKIEIEPAEKMAVAVINSKHIRTSLIDTVQYIIRRKFHCDLLTKKQYLVQLLQILRENIMDDINLCD